MKIPLRIVIMRKKVVVKGVVLFLFIIAFTIVPLC